jgi:hypothetical protein
MAARATAPSGPSAAGDLGHAVLGSRDRVEDRPNHPNGPIRSEFEHLLAGRCPDGGNRWYSRERQWRRYSAPNRRTPSHLVFAMPP